MTHFLDPIFLTLPQTQMGLLWGGQEFEQEVTERFRELTLQPRLQDLNLFLQFALAARRTGPLEGSRPVLEEAPLPLVK